MRLARCGWERLPLAVRAALLMVTGCLLFSVMAALVKLLGQRLDSFQIAFFRCFFGFLAILPLVLSKKGHHAFRTTHAAPHPEDAGAHEQTPCSSGVPEPCQPVVDDRITPLSGIRSATTESL
jgi:hypothetical protein